MASLGSSMASCSISLRFFSPPEKPSLTDRLTSSASMPTSATFALYSRSNSRADSGSPPLFSCCASSAALMNCLFRTPGSSTGYWNARKTPARARSSGVISSRSWPSYSIEPPVTS